MILDGKSRIHKKCREYQKSLFVRRTSICNGTNTILEEQNIYYCCWTSKEMKEWIPTGSKKFWTISRLLGYRDKKSNHILLRSTVTSKNCVFVLSIYTHICIVFSSQYKTILPSDKLYTRLLLISCHCYLKNNRRHCNRQKRGHRFIGDEQISYNEKNKWEVMATEYLQIIDNNRFYQEFSFYIPA